MMTNLILTSFLSLSQLFAPAVDVTGRVIDSRGRSVGKAIVRVCPDVECSEPKIAITNGFGYYKVSMPESDGYYHRIEAKGFLPVEGWVLRDSFSTQVWVLERGR